MKGECNKTHFVGLILHCSPFEIIFKRTLLMRTKLLSTMSSVSESCDMDSENYNMVIKNIGPHSVKLTVLKKRKFYAYLI